MKLEQQVTSLELSKKLKELGVKQESLFWWNEQDMGIESIEYRIAYQKHNVPSYESISAYTVAELGEMLPKEMGGDYGGVLMSAWVNGKEWECTYYSFYNNATASQLEKMPHMHTLSDTEADARAKMLIYLIENKLINNQQ